jgi:hypothetical protein
MRFIELLLCRPAARWLVEQLELAQLENPGLVVVEARG